MVNVGQTGRVCREARVRSIDTFPPFKSALKPFCPSYPSLFHHLHLASHNSLSWLALNPFSLQNPLISSASRSRYAMCAFFPPQPPDRRNHLTALGRHSSLRSQLRDLIICPDERGVVNYVQDQSIMERDITDPSSVSSYTFLLSSLRLSFPVVFSIAFTRKEAKKMADMGERCALSLVCITWYGR